MMITGHALARFLLLLLVVVPGLAGRVTAAEDYYAPTPLRLSYMEGQVSLLRPGAADWAPAQLNFPLETGDALFSADRSIVELQFGSNNYARAAQRSQMRVLAHREKSFQLQVNRGQMALQIGTLIANETVEIDTPYGAFTIQTPGYFRLDVDDNLATFVTREGRASVVTATGEQRALYPNQAVRVADETNMTQVWEAPDFDSWDRWNMDRTASVTSQASSLYLADDVYGTETLGRYGAWQQTPDYGPVWQPYNLSPTWTPYSSGSWVWDTYYGWSWVDTAPWGWAPFHYGRWVHSHSGWGWTPGPRIARSVYAPALVAFLGGGSLSYGRSTTPIGWVPLGWGEPICPWWGRAGWRGRPHWNGWGGPRIINDKTISSTSPVDNNTNIHYRNAQVPNGVVAVERRDFGGRPVQDVRARQIAPGVLRTQLGGQLPARPETRTVVPNVGRTPRPPGEVITRPIVSRGRIVPGDVPIHADTPKSPMRQSFPEPRVVKLRPQRDDGDNSVAGPFPRVETGVRSLPQVRQFPVDRGSRWPGSFDGPPAAGRIERERVAPLAAPAPREVNPGWNGSVAPGWQGQRDSGADIATERRPAAPFRQAIPRVEAAPIARPPEPNPVQRFDGGGLNRSPIVPQQRAPALPQPAPRVEMRAPMPRMQESLPQIRMPAPIQRAAPPAAAVPAPARPAAPAAPAAVQRQPGGRPARD